MIKLAFIKKINENTWRVYSRKGKNMGTFHSLEEAKERLKDIEFFKRKDERLNKYKKASEKKGPKPLPHLSETYSSLLRSVNKHKPEKITLVMEKFKKIFDHALLNETPVEEIENVCLLELIAKSQEDKHE
jgi:ribosomal protein S10